MGILLAFITSDSGYLKMVSSAIQKTDLKAPSDKEQLKLELLSAFDAAEEFIRESAYLHVTEKASGLGNSLHFV